GHPTTKVPEVRDVTRIERIGEHRGGAPPPRQVMAAGEEEEGGGDTFRGAPLLNLKAPQKFPW
uniref:Uncharacterized protein n=1 Tax=Calidris pygmaea TaxID=425635 RepID=A0A8C3K9W7_9CHAR